MPKELKLDNITYEFNPNDSYTPKEGEMEYKFISLKKITSYKGNKKYQNLTIKKEHFNQFKNWLIEIIKGEEDEEVPF